MAKAPEPKTRPSGVPVDDFLASVDPADRRAQAVEIIDLMTATTGVEPIMWGDSIVGWGETSMRYANGGELSWPALGYSPRKTQHTLYFLKGFDALGEELGRLGAHSLGRGCLYIKRFDQINHAAFADLIAHAWRDN